MENGRKNARGKAYLDKLTSLRYYKGSDSGRKMWIHVHVKDYPLCPNGFEILHWIFFWCTSSL